MKAARKEMGRLAMREEGSNWNAYYALPDTMEDAIFLGSIAMRFVIDKRRKKAFMKLMQDAMSDVLQDVIGARPKWGGEKLAPEHERTKEA